MLKTRRLPTVALALLVFCRFVGASPLTIEAELSRTVPMMLQRACVISPDGKLVALSVKSQVGAPFGTLVDGYITASGVWAHELGAVILLVNLDTGERIDLRGTPGSSSYGAVWSPDAQRLAFLSDRDGDLALWIWDRATRAVARASRSMVRFQRSSVLPKWSSDGRHLVFQALSAGLSREDFIESLASRATDPQIDGDQQTEAGQPVVFSYDPQLVKPRAPSSSWARNVDLVLLKVSDQTERTLLKNKTVNWYAFSPDGAAVAYSERVEQPGPARYDVKIVELDSFTVTSAVSGMPGLYGDALAWSPDSRMLAFVSFTRKQGVSSGGAKGTVAIAVTYRDGSAIRRLREFEVSEEVTPRGISSPPTWTGDSQAVLALFDEGLKVLRLDGVPAETFKVSGAAIRDLWKPAELSWTGATLSRGAVLVVATNDADQYREIWRVDLGTKQMRKLWRDASPVTDYPYLGLADVMEDGRRIVFTRENSALPPEFWSADADFRVTRKLADLNSHLRDIRFGSARPLSYLTADGIELKAILLLPPDYREGRRVPLVVDVYPGEHHRLLNNFGFGVGGQSNVQLLATRGYAVLKPDSVMELHHPVDSLVRSIIPAVMHVIATGIADPNAIGIMGYSQGGMSTVALLTKARIFKAGIAAAGYYELFSFYGTLPAHGEDAPPGIEVTNNIVTTPWKNRRVYEENSPYLELDRIRTPLLLLHGRKDGIPISQPRQVFVALRRLGQKVTLVEYPGEGHGLGVGGDAATAHQIDYANRVVAWFDEHLRRRPGPSAADGVSSYRSAARLRKFAAVEVTR